MLNRLMLKRLGVVPTHAVTVRKDLKVRTPDGVDLLTDVYFGNGGAPAPVIMIRSPYGKRFSFGAGMAYPLATQGFNVVMQCCRGTFGSSGTFNPFHNEQRDGLTTIEWIKQQPWYDGSIGTYGLSYLGYTQWAVAAAAGPEVKAMAMQVTLSDFTLSKYSGDSFSLETMLGWADIMTKMKQARGWTIVRFMIGRLLGLSAISKQQWRALPLKGMDETVIGEPVNYWQDWVSHNSSRDPWWAPMNFRRSVDQVKRPITHVAGWYDVFAPWQLQDFAALRKGGCDAQITVGPWSHTDLGMGQTGMSEAIEWFNRHLRGKTDAPARKPVKLYIVGADEWRYFDEWPPRNSVAERWYLQPRGKLAVTLAAASDPDTYRYDPDDPTPSIGGPSLESTRAVVDNAVLERRSDVLTYTSEPMTDACDLIGEVAAELYASSSAASADFFVRLCDVDTRGVSRNICDGLQRVRVEASGVPQRVRVELWPTAYRVARGHRLRVQVSSGAFPRWARNLGGQEPMAVATTPQVATQSIYHSPDHPSAIILPLMRW